MDGGSYVNARSNKRWKPIRLGHRRVVAETVWQAIRLNSVRALSILTRESIIFRQCFPLRNPARQE